MKILVLVNICLLLMFHSSSQSIGQALQKAYQQFGSDAQLKHAVVSLYVVDAATGKVVFDKNSQVGLAPASTQKIITSVTAFELLGKEHRFETEFGWLEQAGAKTLVIKPSGDPTLGSWRWESTKEENVLRRVAAACKSEGLNDIASVIINAKAWPTQPIPDGWIWQDIGNYYGAGARPFNWRENQYDLYLRSGSSIGDPVRVVGTKPALHSIEIVSESSSAASGTGDNAYIYLPAFEKQVVVRGTIPINEDRFEISGAIPDPAHQFAATLKSALGSPVSKQDPVPGITMADVTNGVRVFHTERSPGLDSIIYWFNRKSINLYGEALLKAFGLEKKGMASTDSGVSVIRDFWKRNGLDEDALNVYDGSGLSPLNRVTTHAQVKILQYARNKSWFPGFYDALPEFNGMKMKSGTISDVKGFCGYHKARNGREYIFSFIVNNYSGRASTLVTKMYRVLDVIK